MVNGNISNNMSCHLEFYKYICILLSVVLSYPYRGRSLASLKALCHSSMVNFSASPIKS